MPERKRFFAVDPFPNQKLNYGQHFAADSWLRLWCLILVEVLKLGLVEMLKFGREDLCKKSWYEVTLVSITQALGPLCLRQCSSLLGPKGYEVCPTDRRQEWHRNEVNQKQKKTFKGFVRFNWSRNMRTEKGKKFSSTWKIHQSSCFLLIQAAPLQSKTTCTSDPCHELNLLSMNFCARLQLPDWNLFSLSKNSCGSLSYIHIKAS